MSTVSTRNRGFDNPRLIDFLDNDLVPWKSHDCQTTEMVTTSRDAWQTERADLAGQLRVESSFFTPSL
jgi:hypothetical protein